MTDYCKNCGAELVAGQRFCRRCGSETSQFRQAEMPTRILPSESRTSNPANTSPLPIASTDPVYLSRQTAEQWRAQRQTSAYMPPQQQPASSSKLIYVLVGTALASIAAAIFFFVSQPPPSRRVVVQPPPLSPPVPRQPSAAEAPETVPLGEDEAKVSESQTVMTRTYTLARNAIVSVKNVSGDITVEGWDEDHAEVKIIKRGGSVAEREAVPILSSSERKRLTFETPPTVGNIEVQYQMKLPRHVGQLSIASANAEVKLSDIAGEIGIDLQQGSIELSEVGGRIKSKVMKGNISVELAEGGHTGPQEFSAIKGNIEIQFDGEVNADLKAEAVDGQIEIDDDFGLKVEKSPVGQHVVGRLGAGGEPLLVKTVKGNIKLGN